MMNVDTEDEDYTELQSFLDIEDEEMKEITIANKISNEGKREKTWIGKGHAAKGYKNKYDTYEASTAFEKVR